MNGDGELYIMQYVAVLEQVVSRRVLVYGVKTGATRELHVVAPTARIEMRGMSRAPAKGRQENNGDHISLPLYSTAW